MKKIRLAIVGTGSIAFTHMYGIQRLDEAELVAIMDIHTEQMDTFRKTFPVADEDCYTDLDALLAREDVDAVIVCASDKAHCDIAVRAMRAGKDVLCEKPMALDLDECREMMRIVAIRESAPLYKKIPVSVINLGPVAFVGFGGEPFKQYGVNVRNACPDRFIVTSCNTNGSEGYLVTTKAFEEGGYEASSAPFTPGLEEACCETAVKLISK